MLLVKVRAILFEGISFTELTGLSHTSILLAGLAAVSLLGWLIRGHVDRILHELDTRLAPLVWIFGILFIVAMPASMIKDGLYKTEHISQGALPVAVSGTIEERPNIVLVTMDTLTALDMQLYGYERQTTPFISKWAGDSVVFKSAYASSNWTTPTTMSLMTGKRPWTHQVWYRAIYNPVKSYSDNFPRLLRDAGYDVYGFVQMDYANPHTLGIRDAFSKSERAYTFAVRNEGWFYETLEYMKANRRIVMEWIGPAMKITNLFITDDPANSKPAEMVYDSFLDHVADRDKAAPFFVWLHVFPPHEAYLPPDPYMGILGDPSMFDTREEQYKSFIFHQGYRDERQPEVDILRKRYDEFIMYSDNRFEDFISRLAEAVDMTNTIVVLTADHGESFTHNHVGHGGPHLYEALINIPLVIKMPEGMGREIDIPVEQTDIAPTILEFAGVPVPGWMEGRSLLPAVDGSGLAPRPVYSMKLINNRSFGRQITKGTVAVREGDHKLIYYIDEERSLLYDISEDPWERVDLSSERPEVAQRMKQVIDRGLSEANKRILQ